MARHGISQRQRRNYGAGSIERLPSGRYRASIWISGFKRQQAFDDRQPAKNWLDAEIGERVARE